LASVIAIIDASINNLSMARMLLSKLRTRQVRRAKDVEALKSTAIEWFGEHRPAILSASPALDLARSDLHFRTLLECTSKYATKATYIRVLANAKSSIVELRGAALTPSISPYPAVDDLAPDFSPLAGNPEMRGVLARRWEECCRCVKAEAHLAGIVMMGGLLEALFVARANKLGDKTQLTNAAAAPKDKAVGKALNYQSWMLDSYIKVGRELNWITDSARDVADILKEYRNFIHPEKELRHGVSLDLNDSAILWQVTKALARQLLLSARPT
jgi:hypothetical protein